MGSRAALTLGIRKRKNWLNKEYPNNSGAIRRKGVLEAIRKYFTKQTLLDCVKNADWVSKMRIEN